MLADPQGWDVVVLQDQSETPGGGINGDSGLPKGQGFQESSRALENFFRPRIAAAGARALLYSTWGRHDGDPPNAKCCGYGTFLSMTALTTEGYRKYASVLAGSGNAPTIGKPLIAPCGRAFELVYNR